MQERDAQLQMMATGFRYFNRFMVLMWRLGLGKFLNATPETVGRIMVLVHTGRKSGKLRYTPVNYALINDQIYCMAGFGKKSQWYQNILANPAVEIWLPDSWWRGIAEDVTDHPDRVYILHDVLVASGFAAPLFEGFSPHLLTQQEFENLFETHGYRLIQIRRTEPRTGDGGPGELAWVWQVATVILALGWLLRKKSR